MYQISAFMAGYYTWCLERAETMPRWQGYAVQALAIIGLLAVSILAPGWLILAYWLLVLGPVEVFAFAHYKIWKKRDQIKASQASQLKKTQGLLKGFKR
ncbi:hypothetical protein [Pseudophaeobacter sp.]|uniref:hypothetical protein n=1 Tax=Pseudophaeobacter sp. TaxID=1971739 RepID=UPI0040586AAB